MVQDGGGSRGGHATVSRGRQGFQQVARGYTARRGERPPGMYAPHRGGGGALQAESFVRFFDPWLLKGVWFRIVKSLNLKRFENCLWDGGVNTCAVATPRR